MSRFSIPRAAVVLLGIAIPGAAFAQSATAPNNAPAPTSTSPATAPAEPATPETGATLPKPIAAKIDQHIQQLHDQLQITPAQQSQWDQFAQVMRDNAAKMNRIVTKRSARMASMNAADNMQTYAQLAQVHATNMQKLASSFQSLYATFPDQQKQVADTVFRASEGRPTPRHTR